MATGGHAWRNANLDVSETIIPGLQNRFRLNGRVVFSDQFNNSMDDRGFNWGFVGGYQAWNDRWLLGLELNVGWDETNRNHFYAFEDTGNVILANTDYDRNTVVGLSVRLGFDAWEYIMPYIRLGAERSRDKFELFATSGAGSINIEERRNQTRFVGGFGLEVPVLADVSFRVEYDYHSEGKELALAGTTSDGLTFISARTNPTIHTVNAAVVLNFS